MKLFKDQPIARKALLLASSHDQRNHSRDLGVQLPHVRRGQPVALEAESTLLADNVSAVAFNDKESIRGTLAAYRTKTNIDAVCVFITKRPAVRRLKEPPACVPHGRPMAIASSCASGGHGGARPVGTVRVTGNFSRLYSWTLRQVVGLGAFAVGLLLSLLTQRLARDITGPLQHLSNGRRRITGDYGVRDEDDRR